MTDVQKSLSLPFADTAASEAVARWLAHLGSERRMSPKTVEAYRRDTMQFLTFMAGHLGGPVTLKALTALEPADVRAFMASRRGGGATGRTLARGLAGIRSFCRHSERSGHGGVSALSAVRSPKLPKSLPKPLAAADATRLVDVDLRAGEEREPWVLARDAAVIGLLYGSGLRIAEALALRWK
ncbi:MAG: site-specific integrase, partial [Rhizobiales bacterium]|nr:site-specific integrase [Hyphomicrobiales bacterium]